MVPLRELREETEGRSGGPAQTAIAMCTFFDRSNQRRTENREKSNIELQGETG